MSPNVGSPIPKLPSGGFPRIGSARSSPRASRSGPSGLEAGPSGASSRGSRDLTSVVAGTGVASGASINTDGPEALFGAYHPSGRRRLEYGGMDASETTGLLAGAQAYGGGGGGYGAGEDEYYSSDEEGPGIGALISGGGGGGGQEDDEFDLALEAKYAERNKSSFAQASFNAVNLLLGVGLLSLPYALKVSGWVVGISVLLLLCLVTNYTGKLLGRMMAIDPVNIRTYPDIGTAAFGMRGRLFISVVFFLELIVAGTSFLLLVADNLGELFPKFADGSEWRFLLIATCIVLPSVWLRNLSWLSYFSLLGIISSLWLTATILYEGGSRAHAPGSYRDPATTDVVTPYRDVGLAFGLLMVGFAG